MRRKSLNLLSLSSMQAANAVLPLVVFPYALGIVGSGEYSKLVYSEGLSILLLAVVLFSFEVEGVAWVVKARRGESALELSNIFSRILYVRAGLFIVGSTAVLTIAHFVGGGLFRLTAYWTLVPLSYVVQSGWMFQGLERNWPIAAFTVCSRIVAGLLVLLLLRSPGDCERIPLVMGVMYLSGAIGTLLYAVRRFGVRLVPVPAKELLGMVVSGKDIFLGNLSVVLYRDMNVVTLGVIGVSGTGVAAYSMAEKVVKGMQAALRPLNLVWFPKALDLAQSAGRADAGVFRKLLGITLPQLLILAGILLLAFLGAVTFGERVCARLHIENAGYVLMLAGGMSGGMFFGVCNFMLGTAGLNALHEGRYLFRAIFATGIVSQLACVALGLHFREIGAAVSFVFAEILLFGFVVRKYLVVKSDTALPAIG